MEVGPEECKFSFASSIILWTVPWCKLKCSIEKTMVPEGLLKKYILVSIIGSDVFDWGLVLME